MPLDLDLDLEESSEKPLLPSKLFGYVPQHHGLESSQSHTQHASQSQYAPQSHPQYDPQSHPQYASQPYPQHAHAPQTYAQYAPQSHPQDASQPYPQHTSQQVYVQYAPEPTYSFAAATTQSPQQSEFNLKEFLLKCTKESESNFKEIVLRCTEEVVKKYAAPLQIQIVTLNNRLGNIQELIGTQASHIHHLLGKLDQLQAQPQQIALQKPKQLTNDEKHVTDVLVSLSQFDSSFFRSSVGKRSEPNNPQTREKNGLPVKKPKN